MTRMTGPDCAVMCNLINTHTHTHKVRVGSVAANSDNLGNNKEAGGGAQGAQGSSKINNTPWEDQCEWRRYD